ncbi:MAG: CDP-alcohol phosphatidyltransferase family protein [Candidatus Lokiarchaeota archaeon]
MSRIIDLLKLKDYITLIGTTLGVISIIIGGFGGRSAISLGFFLVTITIGTDLLDGYIARKTNTVNKMGIELDSLSDSLTFGIAPAFLTFQAFKTGSLYDIILIIGSIGFALGAILRLARFNISGNSGYTGVPTPLSALFMIIFFYANYFLAFALGGGGIAGIYHPFPPVIYYLIPFIMILIGWFNITTLISFGKKGKIAYMIFLIFAPLCPIFGIIGIFNPSFIVSIIVSIFFFSAFVIEFIYVLLGFVINIKEKQKKKI